MSAAELAEWKAFYEMDPWGEQRADLRMALGMWATLKPHSKAAIDPLGFMPYADEKNDIPDDVTAKEARWMTMLNRKAGEA